MFIWFAFVLYVKADSVRYLYTLLSYRFYYWQPTNVVFMFLGRLCRVTAVFTSGSSAFSSVNESEVRVRSRHRLHFDFLSSTL